MRIFAPFLALVWQAVPPWLSGAHLCNERQRSQEVRPEGAVAHVVLCDEDAAAHDAAAQVVHHDEGCVEVVRDVQDVDEACAG